MKSDFMSSILYSKFSKLLPIIVFILMIFGGYVKALGAGLACPDWPFCHGQIIPINYGNEPFLWVLMEYIHRLIALSVGILIFIVVLQSYFHRDEVNVFKNENDTQTTELLGYKRFILMLLILTLYLFQVTLGGLTIILDLNDLIVTSHLAVATLIFGLSIIHFTWTKSQRKFLY
ncbi:MAG: heme A synthase [Candidatus Thorarchaeota archaeon]